MTFLLACHPRCSIVTHQTADMSKMQRSAERLGESICWVDDTWDVAEDNLAFGFPLLDGEVLDIDVPGTRCGSARVDHQNRRLIVFIEDCGARLLIVQLKEYRSQVLGNLRCLNGRNKFSFC